jgi:hypothetical protein
MGSLAPVLRAIRLGDLRLDHSPCSFMPYQAVAHAMQCLQIELLIGFRWYAPRSGALHGLSDRMRISKIVLVGPPQGLA